MNEDKFFTDIGNDSPFLKLALEGLAGSGKSHTGAMIAKGLHQQIKSTKPIIIFDTERSSRFLRPLFEAAGIKVRVKESRQLVDLATTMKWCESGGSDVLMIDSITHVWETFLEAYKTKMNRKFLQFQDWGILKPMWKQEFSEPLVAARFNIIFTGRAGDVYAQEINEVTKKKEVVKTGIKMKVEGETAYEPDILVLMERYEELLTDDKKVYREATVLKDRSRLLDGKTFRFSPDDPDDYVWQCFKLAFDFLCQDVQPVRDRKEGDTGMLFGDSSDPEYLRQREIVLEEIKGVFDRYLPGKTNQEIAAKSIITKEAFGTASKTKIESMTLESLREGMVQVEKLCLELKADPSEFFVKYEEKPA